MYSEHPRAQPYLDDMASTGASLAPFWTTVYSPPPPLPTKGSFHLLRLAATSQLQAL